MATKNVTAFIVDPERVFAGGDGVTVPPLPGLWSNDTPVLPEAIGLTLAAMREMVAKLSLPLVETKVAEGAGLTAFAPSAGSLAGETGPDAATRYRREIIERGGPSAGSTAAPADVEIVGDTSSAEQVVANLEDEDGA